MIKKLLQRAPRGRYYPEIDAVRFITVLAIALYHSISNYRVIYGVNISPWFEQIMYGFKNSVQVFFALSGYILSFMMFNTLSKGRTLKLGTYYKRRIRRVEPPFVIAVLLVFFLYVQSGQMEVNQSSLEHLLATISYTHQLIYRQVSSVLSVSWTLELEVLFYLIAPAIGLGLYKLYQKAGVKITLLFLLFGILALAATRFWHYRPLSALSNAPYFMIGIAMALIRFHFKEGVSKMKQPKWVKNILLFLPLIILFLLDRKYAWQEFVMIVAMIGFLYMALFAYCQHPWLKKDWFTIPGGMCYTIYLIHFPIISVVGKGLHLGPSWIGESLLLSTLIKLGLVFLCSIVFYILFEKPFMNGTSPKQVFRELFGISEPEKAPEKQ